MRRAYAVVVRRAGSASVCRPGRPARRGKAPSEAGPQAQGGLIQPTPHGRKTTHDSSAPPTADEAPRCIGGGRGDDESGAGGLLFRGDGIESGPALLLMEDIKSLYQAHPS